MAEACRVPGLMTLRGPQGNGGPGVSQEKSDSWRFGQAWSFLPASAYAVYFAPVLVIYASWTQIITAAVLVTQAASLLRNARIKHRFTAL